MTAPREPVDVEALRAEHEYVAGLRPDSGTCDRCAAWWPCPTIALLDAHEAALAELERLRDILAIIRDERPSAAFSGQNILDQVQALASITLGGAALASGRGGEVQEKC